MDERLPNGKGRGRSNRRWNDDIKESINPDLVTAGKLAQARNNFRRALRRPHSRRTTPRDGVNGSSEEHTLNFQPLLSVSGITIFFYTRN